MGQMEEKGKKNSGSSLPKTLSLSFLLSLCHLILSLLVYHCLSLSLCLSFSSFRVSAVLFSLFLFIIASLSPLFFFLSLCHLVLCLIVYHHLFSVSLAYPSLSVSEALPICPSLCLNHSQMNKFASRPTLQVFTKPLPYLKYPATWRSMSSMA